jgi:hypothetical protein
MSRLVITNNLTLDGVMQSPSHPGSGRRLFPDGSPFAKLRLVDSLTTTTGVVIGTFGRDA